MTDKAGWSWWAVEVDGPEGKPEWYKVNEPTREAALRAARNEYGGTAWIAVVEATQEGDFQARPFDEEGGDDRLMDTLMEVFQDDNGERWGDDGPDFGVDTAPLAKALNDAFERFVRENHGLVMEAAWVFTGQRHFEIVPPEPQSAHATS